MKESEVKRILDNIAREYSVAGNQARGYWQWRINGCLFNLDNRESGFLAVNRLGRLAKGRSIALFQREHLAKDFSIPVSAIFHASLADGLNRFHPIFRNSFGFYYPDVQVESMARLCRWVVRDLGPKSGESRWISERVSIEILEKFLGQKGQVQCVPDFLIGTGKRQWFTLDCYWPELKLAFEYHGYQHFHYPNRFHRSEDDFKRQQERDTLLRKLCKDNGVYLLEMPFNIDLTESSVLNWLREIRDLPTYFRLKGKRE